MGWDGMAEGLGADTDKGQCSRRDGMCDRERGGRGCCKEESCAEDGGIYDISMFICPFPTAASFSSQCGYVMRGSAMQCSMVARGLDIVR